MRWIRDNPLVASFAVFLAAAGLLALVLAYAGLVVSAAFLAGGPVLDVVTGLAFPYLPVAGILLVASVASGFGFCVTLYRRLSFPKSRRVGSILAFVERYSPAMARLDLSSLVLPPKPTPEERRADALADLKRRYVADEITEREFERRLDRLVAADSVGGDRAARERETLVEVRSD